MSPGMKRWTVAAAALLVLCSLGVLMVTVRTEATGPYVGVKYKGTKEVRNGGEASLRAYFTVTNHVNKSVMIGLEGIDAGNKDQWVLFTNSQQFLGKIDAHSVVEFSVETPIVDRNWRLRLSASKRAEGLTACWRRVELYFQSRRWPQRRYRKGMSFYGEQPITLLSEEITHRYTDPAPR